jgi:hypothetical protein
VNSRPILDVTIVLAGTVSLLTYVICLLTLGLLPLNLNLILKLILNSTLFPILLLSF